MRLFIFLFLGISFSAYAGGGGLFTTGEVTLSYKSAQHTFQAEIAETTEARRQGLMHRSKLPEAMLFIFPEEQKITMWMKDTPQSLDMIFIKNGLVTNTEQNTIPYSKTLIASEGKANMVLEVPAGIVAEKEIKKGWEFNYKPANKGQ